MSSAPSRPTFAVRDLVCLALLCMTAFVYAEWIAITQWLSGHWYLADVGNIHYCLTNTLSGRFMDSPLEGGNHFAWHFTPFLLLLVPLTLLSPYPIPLVTGYMLALALCPIPLFYHARRAGLGLLPALALCFLFLCNHFTGSVQLANHFEAWYILFMLSTLVLFDTGGRLFWISAVAALSVKEDAAVWMLAAAAWFWWAQPNPESRRRAVRLGALSVAWGVLAGLVILLTSHAVGDGMADYAPRARGMGFSKEGLRALYDTFGSFAFLPLLAGRPTLLCLVPLPFVLASFPFMRELSYYYSYPFLPFLGYASIPGLVRGMRWSLKMRMYRYPSEDGVTALSLVVIALVQLSWPTRTDGYRRIPFDVSARDRHRVNVAASVVPRDCPLYIQFGLWGVVPTHPDARKITGEPIPPDAAAFLDLQSPHGLDRERYISFVQNLLGEVEAGRRRLILDEYEMLIISPADSQ